MQGLLCEPGLVEGNRCGTSVAAEIVTGKCGYDLPIYRGQDYFAGRCGRPRVFLRIWHKQGVEGKRIG